MNVVKDEIDVKIEEQKVMVERIVVEELDIEEYLRRLTQLEQQKEQADKQGKGIVEMIEKYAVKREEAQKLFDEEAAKVKAEREAAAKKE